METSALSCRAETAKKCVFAGFSCTDAELDTALGRLEGLGYGKPMLELFVQDPEYVQLNHSSCAHALPTPTPRVTTGVFASSNCSNRVKHEIFPNLTTSVCYSVGELTSFGIQ